MLNPMANRQAATELQKSELLKQLFDELLANQVYAWRAANEPDKREALWHTARAIETVRTYIETRTAEIAKRAAD